LVVSSPTLCRGRAGIGEPVVAAPFLSVVCALGHTSACVTCSACRSLDGVEDEVKMTGRDRFVASRRFYVWTIAPGRWRPPWVVASIAPTHAFARSSAVAVDLGASIGCSSGGVAGLAQSWVWIARFLWPGFRSLPPRPPWSLANCLHHVLLVACRWHSKMCIERCIRTLK
jgi:hypothetical protein